MVTWAQHLTSFYTGLQPLHHLPNNIQWLHPQQNGHVMEVAQTFFELYYNDSNERKLLLGINPGRFGAGATGINFTAAKQLTQFCNISHGLKMQSELSAEFIYEVINTYGGPQLFFSRFFIGAVCPLGFVKEGKNINYYDDKALAATVRPFIVDNLKKLLSFGVNTDVGYCIGGDKNFTYLDALNKEHGLFKKLVPLPHPRFILQYRRKFKDEYVQQYLDILKNS